MKKKTLKKALTLGLVLASVSLLGADSSVQAAPIANTDNYTKKSISQDVYSSATWDGAYYSANGGENKYRTLPNMVGTGGLVFKTANGTSTTLPNNVEVGDKLYLTHSYDSSITVEGVYTKTGLIINLDPGSPEDIPTGETDADGNAIKVHLEKAQTSNTTPSKHWMRIEQLYTMDYAATISGFESEKRVIADNQLHMDDINDIVHTVSTEDDTVAITTEIKNNTGTVVARDTADLTDAVHNKIINEAVDAIYEGNISIGEAITNHETRIDTIENNYVSDISETIVNNDYKTWTVTQGDNTLTITDKYINDFTQEGPTYAVDANGNETADSGNIVSAITRNDGETFTQTVNISDYVGDKIKNEAANADVTIVTKDENGTESSQTTTIQNAIQNINNNNVTNITKNDNNSWTVTQTIGGTPNDVTITDTITTASLGNSTNLTLNETIDQNNNTIHYTIDLKDDVTFNSVTAKDINGTTGNFITVNSATVNADAVNANTVTAGKVNTAEVNATVGNIGTVNANAVNAGAVNANQVGTATIYLGTSTDYATIKYDAANDRINYNDEVIATLNDGMKYGADQGAINSLKLNDTLTVSGDKNITTISNGTGQIAVTLNDDISVSTVNAATVNSTTVNSETVNSNTVNSTTMNTTTLNVGNSITIEEGNVDMGGNTITNVYEGGIYQGSMDAVNGGQLWQTNQRLDSLDNRVDKVGAGAAALAALHPLDFDPDDKLSFSAGVGNYAGATASAIGAFYRPDERTMFSIGGTVGNGENMVNAGVSFALGKGGKVTKSRVAMVHEINDLRQQVAELTAMVSQLAAIHSNFKFDSMSPFPDTPENHWAYEYIGKLAAEGIVEGYPDGNFSGDRAMTRYEFGAMLYRALQKGFTIDERLIDEFEPEIGRLSVERIKGELNQRNKIERVRINDEGEDRDVYGGKITVGKTW